MLHRAQSPPADAAFPGVFRSSHMNAGWCDESHAVRRVSSPQTASTAETERPLHDQVLHGRIRAFAYANTRLGVGADSGGASVPGTIPCAWHAARRTSGNRLGGASPRLPVRLESGMAHPSCAADASGGRSRASCRRSAAGRPHRFAGTLCMGSSRPAQQTRRRCVVNVVPACGHRRSAILIPLCPRTPSLASLRAERLGTGGGRAARTGG